MIKAAAMAASASTVPNAIFHSADRLLAHVMTAPAMTAHTAEAAATRRTVTMAG